MNPTNMVSRSIPWWFTEDETIEEEHFKANSAAVVLGTEEGSTEYDNDRSVLGIFTSTIGSCWEEEEIAFQSRLPLDADSEVGSGNFLPSSKDLSLKVTSDKKEEGSTKCDENRSISHIFTSTIVSRLEKDRPSCSSCSLDSTSEAESEYLPKSSKSLPPKVKKFLMRTWGDDEIRLCQEALIYYGEMTRQGLPPKLQGGGGRVSQFYSLTRLDTLIPNRNQRSIKVFRSRHKKFFTKEALEKTQRKYPNEYKDFLRGKGLLNDPTQDGKYKL